MFLFILLSFLQLIFKVGNFLSFLKIENLKMILFAYVECFL